MTKHAETESISARQHDRGRGLASDDAYASANEAEPTSTHEAVVAREQFIGRLAHELRAPLTPTLMALGLLETEAEGRASPGLVMMAQQVAILTRIIDDLDEALRLAHGELTLQWAEVDVADVLRRLEEDLLPVAHERDITLVFELPTEPVRVWADARRLSQAIRHVIDNALKFSLEGGQVRVRAEGAPEGVVIRVRDHGIGIEPSALPRVFDGWARPTQGLRRYGGLGLGLFCARRLLLLHGGRVRVESEGRGRGALVELAFPHHSHASPSPESMRENKPPYRVLLVDDHEDTLSLTKLMLERWGLKVWAATDVRAALALAKDQAFDVVVSDIGLPDGSGLDLLGSLKAIRPVIGIALSGYGRGIDIQRSKEAGFVEHLTKPVNVQRLGELIEQLMSERENS